MYEYCGKVVKVDLTTKEIKKEYLDISIVRDFIGDFGVSLRLAYDLIKPGIDPLSPENCIIIGVGPLVGTRFPATRSSVLTKMPLTGAIAFGNAGMSLGRRLKYAGYDQVIISGRAKKPVYVKISEDDVQLCDANDLWGGDIFETTDEITEKHGKRCAVAAIGQAGENLVKGSLALVDKLSTVGKGGLAAVMGSKNLKAVVVDGTRRVDIADPERFRNVTEPIIKSFKEDCEREQYIKLGKYRFFNDFIQEAGWAFRNDTVIEPGERIIEKMGLQVYAAKAKDKIVGCPGCFYPCKDIWKIREGEYKDMVTWVPGSWLPLRFLFSHGVETYERAIKLVDLCNRYGIDIQVILPTIELAIDLYQRGIITEGGWEDLKGGFEAGFEATEKLIKMVTLREGIGAILADGPLGVINKFGKECEKYSTHIKGMPAQEDARWRQLTMTTFGEIVNPEGGSMEPAHSMDYRVAKKLDPRSQETFWKMVGFIPEEAMDRVFIKPSGYNVGRITRYAQDVYTTMTCLGICDYRLSFLNVEKFAELYSATTGIEMTPQQIRKASDRIWNLYKALNVREGFDRRDDRIPSKWLEPIKTAGGEKPLLDCRSEPLSFKDVQELLDDYYEERGWDVERGIPTKEKLLSLGLKDVIADFEKSGIFRH